MQTWITDYKDFYKNHLEQVILPYWIEKEDAQYGGFFTCYDVMGEHLVSTDKYVWSQGRCTWLYAQLAAGIVPDLDAALQKRCYALAKQGAAFLKTHCILPDGKVAFLVSQTGQPKEPWPNSGYSVSGFADCFVIMGLAAWASLSHDLPTLELAWTLFTQISEQARSGSFPTAPDVLPDGWKAHSVPMILLNTSLELARALKHAGKMEEYQQAVEQVNWSIEQILTRFLQPGYLIAECLDAEDLLPQTLYGRHLNPGHALECVWFLLDAAEELGLPQAAQAAQKICLAFNQLGWDEENGGLFYYVDVDGGPPKGADFPVESSLAQAAKRDWSNKLWWPHVEAMCANLWCLRMTDNPQYLDWFHRYHDYTFKTFPHPDATIGEWIQLRDRCGQPLIGAVGGRLPVKDPYHIPRALIILIKQLSLMENTTAADRAEV